MIPHEFRNKWRNVELKERTASQSHFNDLCALLEIVDPISADPKGEWFTFEKGAKKTGGGDGWADVWRRGHFAWEYKGKHKDLAKAHGQLLQYASALENPPLLIVSDMDRILIHTNWTNTISKTYEITIEDILDAAKRDILKAAFLDPDKLKPTTTRQKLTEDAATTFAALAQRLRERGHEAHEVAHFLIRLVFCLFAEDAGLLPNNLFQKLLELCRHKPQNFKDNASKLFAAMRDQGGSVGFEPIEWFNGGLFDDNSALDLEKDDIGMLLSVSRLDWSEVDASILGTLFERGLDPAKRSQLGAHYTDRDKIMMILNPVVIEPLEAEWAQTLAIIEEHIAKADQADAEIKAISAEAAEEMAKDADKVKANEPARRSKTAKLKKESTAAIEAAGAVKAEFLERLKAFRVLDPACGSGNFLNLALVALKDIEHKVNVQSEALGLRRVAPQVGPENMLGIELNLYAAELARVSVWIGEIQWMRKNGFEANRNPILRPLNTIECRDAVLAPDGSRALWPKADVVVGNPPFLGSQKMKRELGENYLSRIRMAWREDVPGAADLVCHWFAKARQHIEAGLTKRVGLVATNSISASSSRKVLDRIVSHGSIFNAWSDEPWVLDGAAVRVSLICFQSEESADTKLNGKKVVRILSDLTSNDFGFDLTKTLKLNENLNACARGIETGGPFEVEWADFTRFVSTPVNPNGQPNSQVLRRILNGNSVLKREDDRFVIDFGNRSQVEASLFEAPFSHLESAYVSYRDHQSFKKKGKKLREKWWVHRRSGEDVRLFLAHFEKVIATSRVGKHRSFFWLDTRLFPDTRIAVIARDDDASFGILHSKFHEVWSLALGGWHGDGVDGGRPTYTPTQGFETFPFPQGLTPNIPAAEYADDPRAIKIAAAAARLNELRENWLNPADLVVREPEVVAGYPDRILPKDEDAAKILKTRTLTNLYNTRPAWLDNAHKVLDEAVAEAYGWGDDWRAGLLNEDEILSRLFALNQERANPTCPP